MYASQLKLQISVTCSFRFVRFGTLSEALRAIELHDGTTIGKTWISMKPAKESEGDFTAAGINTSTTSQGGKSEDEEERRKKLATGDGRGFILHGPLSCQTSESSLTGGCATETSNEHISWTSGTALYCSPPPQTTGTASGGVATSNSFVPQLCGVERNEPISQGQPLESDSDESWDEELLTSSPFSSGTELGHRPRTTAAVPLPGNLEWNGDTLQLSPRSMPNSDGLISVHVSSVRSSQISRKWKMK